MKKQTKFWATTIAVVILESMLVMTLLPQIISILDLQPDSNRLLSSFTLIGALVLIYTIPVYVFSIFAIYVILNDRLRYVVYSIVGIAAHLLIYPLWARAYYSAWLDLMSLLYS